MKRIAIRHACLALLALLILASMCPALAKGREGAYVVDIEAPHDRLNVHSTPSIGNVFDHLDAGTVVQYQYSDNGWWYVEWRVDDDTFEQGYVDGKYLAPIDGDPSRKFACVDNLYVHSQSDIVPGECANYHIDQLSAGQKVTVKKQDGTWSWVEYGGKAGWVSSLYLVEAR